MALTPAGNTVTWSSDRSQVTKSVRSWDPKPFIPPAAQRYDNERRVNELLLREPAPVQTAALISCRPETRELVFAAVAGETLGPKYPAALTERDLRDLLDLARRLAAYRPDRPWFRPFPVADRLRTHLAAGLLSGEQVDRIAGILTESSMQPWTFAHGDLTARNVIRRPDGGLTLIDWEWAGRYPPGYELAFLWFSFGDLPGGRDRVESVVPAAHRQAFLACAVLIEAMHLHWINASADRRVFQSRHARTLASLLAALDA